MPPAPPVATPPALSPNVMNTGDSIANILAQFIQGGAKTYSDLAIQQHMANLKGTQAATFKAITDAIEKGQPEVVQALTVNMPKDQATQWLGAATATKAKLEQDKATNVALFQQLMGGGGAGGIGAGNAPTTPTPITGQPQPQPQQQSQLSPQPQQPSPIQEWTTSGPSAGGTPLAPSTASGGVSGVTPSSPTMPTPGQPMTAGGPPPTTPEATPLRNRLFQQPVAPNVIEQQALPPQPPKYNLGMGIDPETGKLHLSAQPLTEGQLHNETYKLMNSMMLRGFSPKDFFAEADRRGLPITPDDRKAVGETFFRTTMDAFLQPSELGISLVDAIIDERAGKGAAARTPMGLKMSMAADKAAQLVGQQFMPEDIRKNLVAASELPIEYRARLMQQPGYDPYIQPSPGAVAGAITQKEVIEPTQRATGQAGVSLSKESEELIPGSERALLIDPITGKQATGQIRRGEEGNYLKVTPAEKEQFIKIGGARGVVDTLKKNIDVLFGDVPDRLEATQRGILYQAANAAGKPIQGVSKEQYDAIVSLKQITRNSQLFARALGQTGNLNEYEQRRAAASIPGLMSTRDESQGMVKFLDEALTKAAGPLGEIGKGVGGGGSAGVGGAVIEGKSKSGKPIVSRDGGKTWEYK